MQVWENEQVLTYYALLKLTMYKRSNSKVWSIKEGNGVASRSIIKKKCLATKDG